MNRRQFLTGASAIAVASALPAAPALTHQGVEIAFDLASGPDRTALWVIESTPGGNSWVWHQFMNQTAMNDFIDVGIDRTLEWIPIVHAKEPA